MGKSRLVWELFRHTDAEQDVFAWRQGRALAYGGGPFGAVAEALRAHVGVLESDTPADIETKVTATVLELFEEPATGSGSPAGCGHSSGWRPGAREVEESRRLAAPDRGDRRSPPADPGARGSALGGRRNAGLRRASRRLDERCPAARPLHVAARAARAAPGLGRGAPQLHTIALSPLSDGDTEELLGDLLGRSALDADLRARLLQQTGGNPLYAEEYARMLNTAVGAELPDSVQGIIAARLDLLDPPEKQLLQDASVLGKVFWRGGVQALGAGAADDLLQRLVRKEFIRRERTSAMAGEPEFAFRHALVRDVAYAQLPRAARAEKHRLAAEWIAAGPATRPTSSPITTSRRWSSPALWVPTRQRRAACPPVPARGR